MEKNILNDCGFVSSLQFLDNFTGVCAVDLDDMSTLRSGGNQSTVWVDGDGTDLSVMCWDYEINTFVDD